VVGGRPVLIAPGNELFPPHAYRDAGPAAAPARRFRGTGGSVNLSAARCLRYISAHTARDAPPRVLALGSGRQRGRLAHDLGDAVELIAVDVDSHADVDAWCDAHALPFPDGAFDAVIATAVLEHVLRPERVAAEIARVLRMDGLVYSEIPFMQQVHEGAYDFTRYTLSGHRRLFEAFREIESGLVAGPATALAWSVEHLALTLVKRPRSRLLVKAGVRGTFGWVRLADRRLARRPAAVDGASCTYFLGARRASGTTSDREIVAGYRGAQQRRHV